MSNIKFQGIRAKIGYSNSVFEDLQNVRVMFVDHDGLVWCNIISQNQLMVRRLKKLTKKRVYSYQKKV